MTTFNRRTFLAASASAWSIGSGLAPMLGNAQAQPAASSLILGEARGAGQSAQFLLGAKGGLFEKHGVNATLRFFGSGAEMGPAIVAGSLNVITTGDVPAIPIMAAGAPIKVLCPLSDFSADQAIVTRKDISEPKQLLDKRIALFKGSVATLLIDRYAARHKLDVNRISLIHMDPLQQPAALANGDIDGYISWEPHIWGGTQRIPNTHVLARANDDGGYMQVFGLLLVRQDYLASNKEMIRKLLAALAEALDELKSGKPELLMRVANFIREAQGITIPAETLVEMMRRRTYTMTIDKTFLDAQAVNTEFLHGLGRIKTKPDVRSWIDPEILRSVRPDLVKI
jgi:ABC-type nitrate/sulfonate/bicarbonate transport system substrate-binding protein